MKRQILTSVCLLLLSAASAQCLPADKHSDSLSDNRRWQRSVVSAGTGAALTVGLTQALKSTVHEMRPDRSDNHSFPSRHSSWAFAGASIISHELYSHSGWWVVGAQFAASAIGQQRIMAERHYPGDVLAGAALGLAATETGYWLGRLIFPSRTRHCAPLAENRARLHLGTAAMFPLSGGFRTSYGTAADVCVPVSGNIFVTAGASLHTLPLYVSGAYDQMVNKGVVKAGAGYFFPLGSWYAQTEAYAGVALCMGKEHKFSRCYSFNGGAAGSIMRMVTDKLSVGVRGGYDYFRAHRSVHSLSLSLVSAVNF